jgi:hypothetical protein
LARKLTGRPPGRPKTVFREDGSIDPLRNKPHPKRIKGLEAELYFFAQQPDAKAALARAYFDPPWKEGRWPVSRNVQAVAAFAGVTERAVRKWRKDKNFFLLFDLRVRKARTLAAIQPKRPNAQDSPDGTNLIKYLEAFWPSQGFVVSKINGRRSLSPQTYAKHLKANGCIPEDWVSDDNKAKSKPRI